MYTCKITCTRIMLYVCFTILLNLTFLGVLSFVSCSVLKLDHATNQLGSTRSRLQTTELYI